MTAFVGQCQQRRGTICCDHSTEQAIGERKGAIQLLVNELPARVGVVRQKCNFADTDCAHSLSSLFPAQFRVLLPRAVTLLPKIWIQWRSVSAVDDFWPRDPLEHSAKRDAFVVGMRNNHQGTAQQRLKV